MKLQAGRVAPESDRLVRKGVSVDLVPQIMNRQANLFSRNAAIRSLIANRLGWVDVASSMRKNVAAIEQFREKALGDGIRHVVLMGMGGSSLCPEVFKLVFGAHAGLASFDVLDSTDPAAVKEIASKIRLSKTLFIVASKSGGTVETRSHEAFFIDQFRQQGLSSFGEHFVAITDKGSDLEKFARRNHYRRVFLNPSDIGGRYSALSYFGLVPAAFTRVRIGDLVEQAVQMESLLRERHDESNPALLLGAVLAAGQKQSANKLTFLASKKLAPLVPWIEQLIAESTGKKLRGIVPIDAEPAGARSTYGRDRLFVTLAMAGEPAPGRFLSSSRRGAAPCVQIRLGSTLELGQQFVLWEAATAVAGCFAKINPFDEPNVTESKENTKRILASHEKTGRFPFDKPAVQWGKMSVLTARSHHALDQTRLPDPTRFLRAFLRAGRPPQYLALLGYFKSDIGTEREFARLRTLVRDKTGMATLRGYGPRYLHSIGQLYKGGPQCGLFVVFVKKQRAALPISGQSFGFGELIAAQGLGDAQALLKRRRPTILVAIDGQPASGIKQFCGLVRGALA